MTTVLLVVLVLENVRQKQYPKAISIKLILRLALIVVHVQMFARQRQFIQHKFLV